jgi:hypothetical protein
VQKPSSAVLVSFLSVVVSAAVGLIHCASDNAPIPLPAVAPPSVVVNASTTTALIGPAGGTLAHPSGASLLVPAGSLKEPTRLTLTGISPPADVAGGVPLAQALEAGPEGLQFLKPIELVVPFDPTRVPAGSDATHAQIYTAPQHSTAFVALESSVDLAARLIRTTTVHFSDFVPVLNPNPVFISTASALPDGRVAESYSQSFTATGGNDSV